MSFSSDVKREIVTKEISECCLKAEIYALIKLKSKIVFSDKSSFSFRNTSLLLTRRMAYLLKKTFNKEVSVNHNKRNLDGKEVYNLKIDDANNILEYFKIIDKGNVNKGFFLDFLKIFYHDFELFLLKVSFCRTLMIRKETT